MATAARQVSATAEMAQSRAFTRAAQRWRPRPALRLADHAATWHRRRRAIGLPAHTFVRAVEMCRLTHPRVCSFFSSRSLHPAVTRNAKYGHSIRSPGMKIAHITVITDDT